MQKQKQKMFKLVVKTKNTDLDNNNKLRLHILYKSLFCFKEILNFVKNYFTVDF